MTAYDKEIKGEIPPYLSAKSSDLLVSSIKKKKKEGRSWSRELMQGKQVSL